MRKGKTSNPSNLHKVLKMILNILKITKVYRKEVRRALARFCEAKLLNLKRLVLLSKKPKSGNS
ncbi:MAG: hypothetical protein FWD82_04580 [Defluviitaleaceae bacterium]|nr:hypothetical protein [Defluviitaleaceae bacterium]